jgi:thiol-disulfide isomerase/thioredoxin
MRALIVVGLVAVGLWAVTAAGQEPASIEARLRDFGLRALTGDPPAFTLAGLDGERHTLEGLRGRVALLYFWATWCPHCSRELPASVEKLHQELRGQGLAIRAINIAEPEGLVAEWVARRRVTTPVLLDTDGVVTRAYRVTGTPTVILLDREGRWMARGVGPRDWDTEGRPLLATLLASRP